MALLAHHPGTLLFSVRILHVQGVEIHQSLLIEEEKRALYAERKVVLKKPAQHSSDIIQLIEIWREKRFCFVKAPV